MQRSIYPAKTPPLHHPVPQKPVTVPVMHSPPPPPSSSNSYYPSPYDEPSYSNGGSGGHLHPSSAFTGYGAGPSGFMTDPTTQMGLSVAKAAMSGGTEYAEKNVTLPALAQLYPPPPPPCVRQKTTANVKAPSSRRSTGTWLLSDHTLP